MIKSSITVNEIIKMFQISLKSYHNHKNHLTSICIVLSDNKFEELYNSNDRSSSIIKLIQYETKNIFVIVDINKRHDHDVPT